MLRNGTNLHQKIVCEKLAEKVSFRMQSFHDRRALWQNVCSTLATLILKGNRKATYECRLKFRRKEKLFKRQTLKINKEILHYCSFFDFRRMLNFGFGNLIV